MSSLNDSDEQTSPPATPGSRGVQVANSHFSKMRANKGKSGCLKNNENEEVVTKENWMKVHNMSFDWGFIHRKFIMILYYLVYYHNNIR